MSWSDLDARPSLLGGNSDVAVFRATVQVVRTFAVPHSNQPPPLAPTARPATLPMSTSSLRVSGRATLASLGTHINGSAITAHHKRTARAHHAARPAAADAPLGAFAEADEAASRAMKSFTAVGVPRSSALSSLRAALSQGGTPSFASLHSVAASLDGRPSDTELTLGAACAARALAAATAWHPPSARNAAAALLTSGALGALVRAMAQQSRDAEVSRDGALAVGAWALASLAGGTPGSESDADPLALFAAAALERLAETKDERRGGPGAVRMPPAVRTGAAVQAPQERLGEARALLAARRRVASELLAVPSCAAQAPQAHPPSPLLASPPHTAAGTPRPSQAA